MAICCLAMPTAYARGSAPYAALRGARELCHAPSPPRNQPPARPDARLAAAERGQDQESLEEQRREASIRHGLRVPKDSWQDYGERGTE